MYERITRPGHCYQITYGPTFVHVVVLTGIAWDAERHAHSFIIPNAELRPENED